MATSMYNKNNNSNIFHLYPNPLAQERLISNIQCGLTLGAGRDMEVLDILKK